MRQLPRLSAAMETIVFIILGTGCICLLVMVISKCSSERAFEERLLIQYKHQYPPRKDTVFIKNPDPCEPCLTPNSNP